MNRMIKGVLVVMSLAMASPAMANPARRQVRQQQRIAQGLQSGQLTGHEAARLERHEVALHREIRADRQANGGKLTPAERVKIAHQQNRMSRHIYRQKHDAQQR